MKKKLKRKLSSHSALFLLFCLLFSSCNYHFVDGEQSTEQVTISIPYVKNDFQGVFTDALVREVSKVSTFSFRQGGGRYLLEVELLEDIKDDIGFKYDRNDFTGKRNQNLLPCESRRTMIAKVTLLDTYTNTLILGPIDVEGNSEYDYVNPFSINELAFIDPQCCCETVLNFSLGQLDAVDSAQDNALFPLFDHLSSKIANMLLNHLAE